MDKTTSEFENNCNWLIAHGGPAMRYRTARDLLQNYPEGELLAFRRLLMQNAEVRIWLERLNRCIYMHNGTNDRFENIICRLTDMGLDHTFSELDRQLTRFHSMLKLWSNKQSGGMLHTLNTVILTLGLARAGYTDDEVVVSSAQRRFAEVYQVIKDGDFDFFYPPDAEPKKPSHFKAKRVVRSKFTPQGKYLLPYLYDLYLASAFPAGSLGIESEVHINEILAYILNLQYQQNPPGEGILLDDHDGKDHYYAIGWSAELPGFSGQDFSNREAKALLLRLDMAAVFKKLQTSQWFSQSLTHLETFKQEDGMYSLPAKYMVRMKEGYWILGNHMRLQQKNERTDRVVDATFRMLALKKKLPD